MLKIYSIGDFSNAYVDLYNNSLSRLDASVFKNMLTIMVYSVPQAGGSLNVIESIY